jgi:hypothetical protein
VAFRAVGDLTREDPSSTIQRKAHRERAAFDGWCRCMCRHSKTATSSSRAASHVARWGSVHPDGSLVLSMALIDGDVYEVTRHVYPVLADPMRLTGPPHSNRRGPDRRACRAVPGVRGGHTSPLAPEIG